MSGISIALLLITIAVGYKVLVRAEEVNKSYLKRAGQILGIIIIAASLISIGCIAYKIHWVKAGCPWSSFKCPYKKAVDVEKGGAK